MTAVQGWWRTVARCCLLDRHRKRRFVCHGGLSRVTDGHRGNNAQLNDTHCYLTCHLHVPTRSDKKKRERAKVRKKLECGWPIAICCVMGAGGCHGMFQPHCSWQIKLKRIAHLQCKVRAINRNISSGHCGVTDCRVGDLYWFPNVNISNGANKLDTGVWLYLGNNKVVIVVIVTIVINLLVCDFWLVFSVSDRVV